MALGCFLVAAITFTVSKIGTNALIPLSQEFVGAGAPESSYFQTLGDFLYNSVDKRGYEIYGLFNELGIFTDELPVIYIKVYPTRYIYMGHCSTLLCL